MNCRVCGHEGTYELPIVNHPCGRSSRWFQCLYCGSQSCADTYAEVSDTYTGSCIQDHLRGQNIDLKLAESSNHDWFTKIVLPEKTFLDIGSATGAGMEGMRDRGFECWGFDVMPYAQECASPVVVAPEFEASLFDRQFGAIMAREVIEHVDDWRGLLIQVRQALLPNGVFQVQTPRVTAPGAEVTNSYFRSHLQIFSPLALQHYLRSSGFVIINRKIWDIGQLYLCRKPCST